MPGTETETLVSTSKYRGYMGFYRGYIGLMEYNMDTTIGFRVQLVEVKVQVALPDRRVEQVHFFIMVQVRDLLTRSSEQSLEG